jgi:hypothetical protein
MSLPSIVNKNKPLDDSTFVKLSNNEIVKQENIIPFWTEDPNILFNKDYIFEFYPTSNMSYYQKLNTVTRVILIITLLLFLVTRNYWLFVVAGITIFAIYVLYKNNKTDIAKKHLLEGYENPAQVYLKENGKIIPSDNEVFETPTSTNPFSNILIPDYEYNPTRKGAPPISNEMVGDVILQKAKDLVQEQNPDQTNISEKLFKNMNDELSFEQSLRPFYSTSNTTIPNDQSGFVDFCYGSSISCKEGNLFACARNTSHYTLY